MDSKLKEEHSVELRQFQLFQLDILKEFMRVCDEHGLCWWLAYGSLLGAARHGGFIPWDDDIDVLMPAEDYLKFREICTKGGLSKGFYIQSHALNPCNFIGWQRIGVENSTSLPYEYADVHAEWGVCIDIFPLFPVAPQESLAASKADATRKKFDRLTAKYLYRHRAAMQDSALRRLYYRMMGGYPDSLNISLWNKEERKVLQPSGCEKWAMGTFDDPCSYPSELFARTTVLSFEGMLLPVPEGYKDMLEIYYGSDWAELPPEEKRVCHSGGGSAEVMVSLVEPYRLYLK